MNEMPNIPGIDWGTIVGISALVVPLVNFLKTKLGLTGGLNTIVAVAVSFLAVLGTNQGWWGTLLKSNIVGILVSTGLVSATAIGSWETVKIIANKIAGK